MRAAACMSTSFTAGENPLFSSSSRPERCAFVVPRFFMRFSACVRAAMTRFLTTSDGSPVARRAKVSCGTRGTSIHRSRRSTIGRERRRDWRGAERGSHIVRNRLGRVHRRDDHAVSGKSDRRAGPRDRHHPVFKRLTQGLEGPRVKLGKLVEKKYSLVGGRPLPPLGGGPPPPRVGEPPPPPRPPQATRKEGGRGGAGNPPPRLPRGAQRSSVSP